MTGDIGGAPALARRRRIPAAGCDSGEHSLEAIERANETIRNHVMQYLARAARGACSARPRRLAACPGATLRRC